MNAMVISMTLTRTGNWRSVRRHHGNAPVTSDLASKRYRLLGAIALLHSALATARWQRWLRRVDRRVLADQPRHVGPCHLFLFDGRNR